MAWIWYGAPSASSCCSGTQNESRLAGEATMLSCLSNGSVALTTAVPRICTKPATLPFSALYCCTAVCGWYWLSRTSSFTLYLPAMPPAALRRCTNTWLPFVSGFPMMAAGLVCGVMTPSVIVVPSKPGTVAGAFPALLGVPPAVVAVVDLLLLPPHAAATSASAVSGTSSLAHRDRLLTWYPPLLSVRERPGLEVRLEARPHGGQPARLEQQECHDQHPEEHLVQREHGEEAAAAALVARHERQVD